MIFSQAFRNEQFSPAVALFSAAGLIKTTAGIKEEEEEKEGQQQHNRKKGDYMENEVDLKGHFVPPISFPVRFFF